MKKLFMRKTAGLVAVILMVSMLVPIIAFAASVSFNLHYETNADGTYKGVKGTVTVDKDVYDAYHSELPVYVYNPDGTYWSVVTATYNGVYDEASGWQYDFNSNDAIFNSYDYVNLKYFYNGQVADDVYSFYGLNYTGPSGGGGIPVVSNTINVGADGKIDAASLIAALKAGNGSATLNLAGEFVLLPASALVDGGTLTVVAGGASYILPLDTLKVQDLAAALGVTVDELTIRVDIHKLDGDDATAVSDAVYNLGGKELADATEFKLTAIAGDNVREINDFGNTYVSRTLTLNETPDASANVTGVLYDPKTGEFSFVPTKVDGTTATLMRTGNSIYTVIDVNDKTFADLNGHWSQAEVEKLASHLIVNGVGANQFEPNRSITRAEFAAIVVRSLGLTTDSTTSQFKDVSSGAWYAADVAAAAKAGIVNGYTDGTFKPSANITRQELATMVVRASKFAGKDLSLTDADVASALSSFVDAGKLTWAKDDVAAAVEAGIVQGQSATMIAPTATATRAESAAMVLRFLTGVDFIS